MLCKFLLCVSCKSCDIGIGVIKMSKSMQESMSFRTKLVSEESHQKLCVLSGDARLHGYDSVEISK